ncbi:MAG: tRNA 2-thiocytidine biosynthesis TtcA family protein, partial [Oscillospiraceae bacterium]
EEGDRVAVGLSGGKDSVALLAGLAGLRRFLGVSFTLTAITLDPCFGGVETDYSPLEALCAELEVPYIIKRTRIGEVVFEERQEEHPCSLCAKMRRGVLHEQTKLAGCNKLALGHHMDDAIETFVMNLTVEGRIACYQPVSYLSRRDITMIRPLSYAPEREIAKAVRTAGYPVVKSSCPVDGVTRRQKVKDFLREQEKLDPGLKNRIFGAIRRGHISDW